MCWLTCGLLLVKHFFFLYPSVLPVVFLPTSMFYLTPHSLWNDSLSFATPPSLLLTHLLTKSVFCGEKLHKETVNMLTCQCKSHQANIYGSEIIVLFYVCRYITWFVISYQNHHIEVQHSQELTSFSPQMSTSPYFVLYPHKYSFVHDEPNRCQHENPFLVLMIPVAPSNVKARDVIRSTWGNVTTVNGQAVSLFFLLGLPAEGNITHLNEQVSDF